jgi:hypothetical protein
MKKLEKLKSLMGKKFKHKDGGEFMFFTYKLEKEKVTIVTDSIWLETNIFDIDVFLENYKQVIDVTSTNITNNNSNNTSPQLPQNGLMPMMKTINTDIVDKLKTALIDNIEKVQKDEKYVNQAKAICNSVQSLVNLAKLELDIRRKI